MATGSKAGLYQNVQSASYLPPTLCESRFYFSTERKIKNVCLKYIFRTMWWCLFILPYKGKGHNAGRKARKVAKLSIEQTNHV